MFYNAQARLPRLPRQQLEFRPGLTGAWLDAADSHVTGLERKLNDCAPIRIVLVLDHAGTRKGEHRQGYGLERS